MCITWRQRLEQQPSLRQFTHWPIIPLDSLPKQRRKMFLRNQQIVAQAITGEPFKEIAQRHNIAQGRISQLLKRCLGGDVESSPLLTQGLIPYRNIVESQRKGPLATLSSPRGNACAFKALLRDVPGLVDALDEMIEAKLKDAANAQLLTRQAFHGEFKRILAEIHWPQDKYPYTCESLAYESTSRYLKYRTKALQQEHLLSKKEPSRNLGLTKKRCRAMRAIQIDEQIFDLNSCVHLQLNDD